MTSSLIDSLETLVTPELSSRIATSLNAPVEGVTGGLNGGMASMLMGILGKTGDASAMKSIFGIATHSDNDGRSLEDPASWVGAGPDQSIAEHGSSFLTQIFGDRASGVNSALSRVSGLSGASIGSLMNIAAPLVLGVLGKRVRENGLNAESFTRLFTDERESILTAAPAGVADALGMDQRAPQNAEYELPREAVPRADQRPEYASQPVKRKAGWVWPTVAALVVLALYFGTRGRNRAPSEVVIPLDTNAQSAAGEVAPSTPSSPSIGVQRIQLPNGYTFNVVGSSPEARMVTFLTDSAGRISDTSWMVLDHMQFETNSAKLRPESKEQIDHIASVMKAFPNATVRIGGFTDSTGDEAANMKLSKDRAESTRGAIIAQGISPARVGAQGFGSTHPVATNSTEDGRAQNRRISMLITHK